MTTYELPFWNQGPNYFRIHSTMLEMCETKWWSNLLMINNLYPEYFEESCFPHTWILTLEFQFTLCALLIGALFCKSRKLGYIIGLLFTVGSIVISFAMGLMLKYQMTEEIGPDERFVNWWLAKPWTRFAPYGVGIVLGMGFFSYRF